jgi:hypothetical protein
MSGKRDERKERRNSIFFTLAFSVLLREKESVFELVSLEGGSFLMSKNISQKFINN